jgi:hypothetical protein
MLTIGRAEKQAGVSKATLTRAFRSRRISANKNADGWDSAMKRNAPPAITKVETPETAVLMTRMDVEIDWLKAQMEKVKMMRKQLADMKVQSDKWHDQEHSAQRLLTDTQPQRRGWFSFVKAIWPPKWRLPSETLRVDVRS